MKINIRRERGSLALEQVLFIGAIVAIASAVWVFYDSIGSYFEAAQVGEFSGENPIGTQGMSE